jgi:hypothetical protein
MIDLVTELEPVSDTSYHHGYYDFYSSQTSYQDLSVDPSQLSQTYIGDVTDFLFLHMLFSTPSIQVHFTFI